MCNIVSIPMPIYKSLSAIISSKLKGILSLAEVNIPLNKKQEPSKKISSTQSIEKQSSLDKSPDSKENLSAELLNSNSSTRLSEVKALFKKSFIQSSEEEAEKFYEFLKKVRIFVIFYKFFEKEPFFAFIGIEILRRFFEAVKEEKGENYREALFSRKDLLKNLIIGSESEKIASIFSAVAEIISEVISISLESRQNKISCNKRDFFKKSAEKCMRKSLIM